MAQSDVSKEMEKYYQTSEAYLKLLSGHDEAHFQSYVAFVRPYVQSLRGQLLEIGCGCGESSRLLAKEFPNLEVLGVDLSEKFIEYARATHQAPGLQFKAMNVCQLELPERSAIAICSKDCIEHIPDVEAYLRECDRVLQPGGWLLIMSPNLLNPVMPLYMSLRGRKHHGYRQPLGKALAETRRLYRLYRAKRVRPGFTYIDPVLDDAVQTGSDADAVFLSNPLDLAAWLRNKGYRIANYVVADNHFRRVLKVLCKYWVPVGIAAQKPA